MALVEEILKLITNKGSSLPKFDNMDFWAFCSFIESTKLFLNDFLLVLEDTDIERKLLSNKI